MLRKLGLGAALLGIVAGAASGEALFKRSTFLTGLDGTPVASPLTSAHGRIGK